MTTLFLAWRSPHTRSWYTVGRLTTNGIYRFVYTRGAEQAAHEGGFDSIAGFPDRERIYESEELFPLFANRMLSRSRPDYAEWVQWLSLAEHADDPVALLARSGGQRATDSFEVFPCPERRPDGSYHVHFFAHGLRHFPPGSVERAAQLVQRERLLLMHDFQNTADPSALMLRTAESRPGDIHPVGYCPRYLLGDVRRLLEHNPDSARVEVERVNPPPAPVQFRVLCNLTMRWAEGFQPFSEEAYRPIPDVADLTPVP
jgi:hypothetical protein